MYNTHDDYNVVSQKQKLPHHSKDLLVLAKKTTSNQFLIFMFAVASLSAFIPLHCVSYASQG